MLLGRIVGEVVEPLLSTGVVDLQFPVAHADRPVVPTPPVERLVRMPRCGFVDEREQVGAVDDAIGRQRGAGGGRGRRVDIEVRHRLGHTLSLRQPSRPPHEERHPQAALEKRRLPAAIRLVEIVEPEVVGTAVVAREDHERVTLEPLLPDRVQHAADVAVEIADHRRIHAERMVANLRQGVVIGLRGLQR